MPLELNPAAVDVYGQNKAPGSYLDMLGAAAYRAVGAGLRLGVFAALHEADPAGPADTGRKALSAAALAEAIGADPRGTQVLADVLVRFGYLTVDDGRYANSDLAAVWLTQPGGYTTVERFWSTVLFELWDNLEEAVRSGAPPVNFYQWLDQRPELSGQFQSMLDGMARSVSAEIVDLVAVPDGGGSLLDIGGGHARYAVALCQHHPGLRATVLDLPGALVAGAEVVSAAELGDRVTLRAGDYDAVDLGSGHDVVLLFNVLHGRDVASNQELLRRAAGALADGGMLVVLDHDADVPASTDADDEAFLRMFSLNLFLGQGGQVYRTAEIVEWLAPAGLTGVSTRRLRRTPLMQVVTATKPA